MEIFLPENGVRRSQLTTLTLITNYSFTSVTRWAWLKTYLHARQHLRMGENTTKINATGCLICKQLGASFGVINFKFKILFNFSPLFIYFFVIHRYLQKLLTLGGVNRSYLVEMLLVKILEFNFRKGISAGRHLRYLWNDE